jgi:hypothetical protein
MTARGSRLLSRWLGAVAYQRCRARRAYGALLIICVGNSKLPIITTGIPRNLGCKSLKALIGRMFEIFFVNCEETYESPRFMNIVIP